MLMDDYTKGRVIDEIKNFDYPDKRIIIDILEKLKMVIYPGYYRNSSYRTYTVRSNISILLEDIMMQKPVVPNIIMLMEQAQEYGIKHQLRPCMHVGFHMKI
jgi:serine O-acetyltransferase